MAYGSKVSTSVSSTLKTKMPLLKKGAKSVKTKLSGVKIPKGTQTKGGAKLSSKTKKGTAVKAPKPSTKAGSIMASLKSIISKASKVKKTPMAMSSAVGAPASIPSPAFFGRPNAGPGKIGLGM